MTEKTLANVNEKQLVSMTVVKSLATPSLRSWANENMSESERPQKRNFKFFIFWENWKSHCFS